MFTFQQIAQRGAAAEQAWNEMFKRFTAAFPDISAILLKMYNGEMPNDWSSG